MGVGNGLFLQAAKDEGYSVMGCDLSAAICRKVETEIGVPMHCGSLRALENNVFDVVVMNHVLEHAERPIEFLQDVSRLLVPSGLVHIAVPNIACWEARLSGWTSYEPYHLSYFDRRTLEKTIEAAGLRLYSFSTKESFSGWFLAILRTGLRINRDDRAVTMPLVVSVTNSRGRRSVLVEHAYRLAMIAAGGILTPVRWLQGNLGYGDELICIVRKQLEFTGE